MASTIRPGSSGKARSMIAVIFFSVIISRHTRPRLPHLACAIGDDGARAGVLKLEHQLPQSESVMNSDQDRAGLEDAEDRTKQLNGDLAIDRDTVSGDDAVIDETSGDLNGDIIALAIGRTDTVDPHRDFV
ncbi:hypothetical protein LQG66_01205 [Bradyrhizobium ontarionense]|uniref:Uncharacterized protein n=1 Tax=Bradyrhizobium ontarionense TaxID=2898149 RepID=A0ABY3RE46_9BRAD|nr:hypothetical protein [Bradyrhizobium sp. A19]UFZ04968.1 hypothetical protein LQG66_01205 [Bradyrhizobium sp. A19]